MKVITIDEKTREGREMLAHLTMPKQSRRIINPFPFSIIERACIALLDLFEYVARHVLLPRIESVLRRLKAVLRKFFRKR